MSIGRDCGANDGGKVGAGDEINLIGPGDVGWALSQIGFTALTTSELSQTFLYGWKSFPNSQVLTVYLKVPSGFCSQRRKTLHFEGCSLTGIEGSQTSINSDSTSSPVMTLTSATFSDPTKPRGVVAGRRLVRVLMTVSSISQISVSPEGIEMLKKIS
jgi:hypothetical protein